MSSREIGSCVAAGVGATASDVAFVGSPAGAEGNCGAAAFCVSTGACVVDSDGDDRDLSAITNTTLDARSAHAATMRPARVPRGPRREGGPAMSPVSVAYVISLRTDNGIGVGTTSCPPSARHARSSSVADEGRSFGERDKHRVRSGSTPAGTGTRAVSRR